MTKLAAVLSGCLALVLVATGCGGGGSSDNNKSSAQTQTQTQTQTSTASGGTPQTASVKMKNIQFNPQAVAVPVGGTVKWTNDDSVGHDVTSSTFKSGSRGGLNSGDTYSHTFNKAGTYKYRCTIHPGMTGTVVVK